MTYGEKWDYDLLKFVGVDYGLARVGLAVSDPEERLAFPLATLHFQKFPSRKVFLTALAERIVAEGAGGIVMGLPVLADGGDSLTTRQVRNATARLKRRMALPVFYMSEVLSSAEAWADLNEAGLAPRRRRAVLDQQAAVRILSSFLALSPEKRTAA